MERITLGPYAACQQQFDAIFERYVNGLGGMNALICKETNRRIGLFWLLVQTMEVTVALEMATPFYQNFGVVGKQQRLRKNAKKSLLTMNEPHT